MDAHLVEPAEAEGSEPSRVEAVPFTSFCYAPNLVFASRNHAYGAFRLRAVYHRRLSLSLCIGVLVFSAGLASPIIYRHIAARQVHEADFSRVVELKQIEPPPLDPKAPPPPPVEPPPPPPKVATVRFVPPEVAHDEEVVDEEIPPPQEELKTVQAAAITQEGDPEADPNEIIVEDVVNTEAEVVGMPVPQEEEEEVFIVVEQMPEIIGGSQEIYRLVEYPELARQAGIEGLVVVQVVVEPDGSVSGPLITRSAGAVLDEAAMLGVMKLRFIPGKQRGMPVRVKVALPIRFRLKDLPAR